jgi:hypothetical protein
MDPMYRDQELGVVFHHGVLARHAFPLRLAQWVNVLFSAAEGLLFIRFLLIYVQAGASSFTRGVARATDIAYVPMRELFGDGHDAAGHPLAWALVVAGLALAVLQWSIVSWLRDVARPGVPDED